MQFRSRYALLLAAPLAFSFNGCANRPVWPSAQSQTPRQSSLTAETRQQTERLQALAREYDKQGRPDQAERLLRRAHSLAPHDQEIRDEIYRLANRGRTVTPPGSPTVPSMQIAAAPPAAAPPVATQAAAESLAAAESPTIVPDATIQTAAITESPIAAANAVTHSPAEFLSESREDASNVPGWDLTAGYGDADELPQVNPDVTDSRLASEPSAAPAPETEVATNYTTSDSWLPPVRIGHDPLGASTGPPAAVAGSAVNSAAPADAAWSPTSLTRLCKDAHAAVLEEVRKLESADAEIRKEGLVALEDMGGQASTAALAVRLLLEDEAPMIRAHAAATLWSIDGESWSTVDTLTGLLHDIHPDVVQFSCYVLGSMESNAVNATGALQDVREDGLPDSAIHAAEALLRINPADEASFQTLAETLAHGDIGQRWLSAVALANVSGELEEKAIEALVGSLADEEPDVRIAAALSLGGFGENASLALADLEEMSLDGATDVQEAARTALACIRQ